MFEEQLRKSNLQFARSKEQDIVKVLKKNLGQDFVVSTDDVHYEVYGNGSEIWFYLNKPFIKFGPIESEFYYEDDNYKMRYTRESYKYEWV